MRLSPHENTCVVISATAPVDRGGHTKVWGIIEGTSGDNEGYVRKSASDPYVDANSLGDTYRAAFFDKVNQFGWGKSYNMCHSLNCLTLGC